MPSVAFPDDAHRYVAIVPSPFGDNRWRFTTLMVTSGIHWKSLETA
jgi:hypothetical protein